MNPPRLPMDPSRVLDPWCRALLARVVRQAGLDPDNAPNVRQLGAAFQADPRFSRLLEAYSDLLREPANADADTLREDLLRQEPALAAHVALAEACAAALPEVLAGDLAATDVLFPGGGLEQVEPIYRDNPWADYFSRLTAEACLQVVDARRAQRPDGRTRILEIGAGTGGTTGFVLDRLADRSGDFDYVYTDLSPGFVQQGRRLFEDRGYAMEFRRLDIEQDPVADGFAPGLAQVVIATNVLHATRRIDATLTHVRSLLADDGLLLLNELTRADAFAALTFGLLDGWWLFEDAQRRLPNGPILSAASWRAALSDNGFGAPAIYGWNGREDGFQCLFVSAAAPAWRGNRPNIPIARNTPATRDSQPAPAFNGSAHAGLPVESMALRRQVRATLARRLGFAETEIGWDQPFAEVGVDSIVAPQFAADLAEVLRIPVDAVDIYNHGTVAMLAAALRERAPVPQSAATSSPTTPAPQPPGDIAIIGLACRFAGARDTEAFWELLESGQDATQPVGAARWSDPDLNMTAGLLPEADCFDPDFFRLAHAEAEVMDPQQRVFLEECWHALEDAGLGPKRLDGKSCGIFVGVAAQHHPANQGEARAALGNSNAILAARIAYHLNLKGPAVPVDTACSSSLVAIHLAAQSIRDGDCDLALAGGVSVLLCNAALPRFLVEAGMVSPTGVCRAFDSQADGFVPGEGVGVVVLRRLDQALAEGDRILGVIRASGINQDGRTSGITAPSGPAQTALLQRVWKKAGIDPASLSLIEAHGTGTPLGDPIEVQSLTAAFAGQTGHEHCALGSVKTNIGHTLTAAGVASVAKVLLALRQRTIPPSLHVATPNPRLNLENSPFYVPARAVPWRAEGPRRAAVSSFGFSGTNAHLVIEEAPAARDVATAKDAPNAPALLLFSAANPAALRRLAGNLAEWLADHPDAALADLRRTLNAGRAFLGERAAFLVEDLPTFQRALRALAEGRDDPALRQGNTRAMEASEPWRIGPDDDPERLARHFLDGGSADWEQLGATGRVLSLPGYPFARDRFPLPAEPATARETAIETMLPSDDPGFVDHRWDGRSILPATALLTLAARTLGDQACMIETVGWRAPLAADNRTGRLRISAQGSIQLVSDEGIHAEASIRPARPEETPHQPAPAPASASPGMSHAEVYRRFVAMGFEYGPAFRVIQGISTADGQALARLDWPAEARRGRIPAIGLLDGVLQSALGLLGSGTAPTTVLPIGLERAWINLAALTAPLRVAVREPAPGLPGERRLELQAWNAAGATAVRLEGLTVRVLESPDPIIPLIYRPIWLHAPSLPENATMPEASVLLFDQASEDPSPLGPGVIRVQPGERYERLAEFRYAVPPGDPAALASLANDLAKRGLHPDVWVNLWPLAATAEADERLALGPWTLLHGLRAWLPHRDKARALRVVQVSQAADAAALDSDPAHAATAALLRSVAGEEPRFAGLALGLPVGVDVWPGLLAELAATGEAVEIFRDAEGRRQVRGHQSVAEPVGETSLPKGAVCVITGGFGGLGLALARRLWQSHGARLALLGRSPPTTAVVRELARWRAEGAEILELRADVSDAPSLRAALDTAARQLGELRAVFHLAGAQADGYLRQLDPTAAAAVLAPKTTGTRALLLALADHPAARLVAFGSLAGAFGAPGQAPYAAANRAMAALLEGEFRQHPERSILHLDWGYWDPAGLSGGMATEHRDAASVGAATGLLPFEPTQGLALLDRILAAPLTGRLLLARGRRAAFEAFMADSPVTTSAPTTPSVSTPPADPDTFLAYLTGIVAEITRTPADRLGADRALDEFGIDSIMITRLNARLERDLGRISKTLFFEHPNLRSLAGHLAQRHGAALPRTAAAPTGPRPIESPTDAGAVAIIGMAGRFPEAGDLDAYWRNLREGRVCIREIPPDRWPLEGFYDPDPNRTGSSYSKWGGFIDGVDRFDALFFNIAPDEAARMDPQERLFLETAWQCLEDAGLTRASLGPTGERDIGAYVGVMYGDYQLLAQDAAGANGPIGGAAPYWSIANRTSYVLGLEGPSLAVDTACSSSLTAVHLACQAIAAGDCRMALVGGVNLSLHPAKYIGLSQGRFAATDGRCRSFADGGDGYVPGEGVAAVLLKPLSAALADGDRIHGVIRGSAANHGGRTNGYTVPNPVAQAGVIRRALRRAGIGGSDLGYIEAHGTGTRLGDPIEIEGLVQALGDATPRGAIPLGSAKAAIGHLEAAAGLAGLIKVLLQMRHGRYPPLPMAGPVNADIDFTTTPLRLQTEPAEWPPGPDGRRYAGVSSFGAGGANAHVIVQDAPPRIATRDDGTERVIPLSARTQAQVRALAGALAEQLANPDHALTLADLCHTLTAGREALRWRCAFVACDPVQAQATLAAIAVSIEGPEVNWGEAPDDSGPTPERPIRDELATLAHFWCAGGAALWPHQGARISLAPRPFLGARHWLRGADLPTVRASQPVMTPSTGADWVREPRVPREGEMAGWTFTLPPDSTLLSHHIVGGERLLPGAAIVAMALELEPAGIRELTWVRPIQAGSAPLRLDFSLRRESMGTAFEVRDADAATDAILASGVLAAVAATPGEPIRPTGGDALESRDFYPRLHRLGLEYGERFQVLQRLWRDPHLTRAELSPTMAVSATIIDPALLDGAFQSLAGLLPDLEQAMRGEAVPVPHTLSAVAVLGDPQQARQVVARRLSTLDDPVQRFELTLADQAGQPVMRIGGLTARRRTIAPAEASISLLQPIWVHRPGPTRKPARAVIVAAPGAEALAHELAAHFADARVLDSDGTLTHDFGALPATLFYLDTADGALPPPAGEPTGWTEAAATRSLRLLDLLRRLTSVQPTGLALQRLLIVTAGVHAVQASPGSERASDAAGLQGLAKVAAREMPGIPVVAVDLSGVTDPRDLHLLAPETGDVDGAEIAYRHGRRFVRRLQPLEVGAGHRLHLARGDACLIIGGAGGVGGVLAEHWAHEYGARVVLVGRRAADARIMDLLDRLRTLGGDGRYLQADATDPAALAAAVGQARVAFGPIRLAVHGALSLRDKTLALMDNTDFLAAFEPRAAAGAALLAAFADQPPPALLLFSSANVFLGQHGQGNYVAGNAALAALGQAARARGWPVSLVHWGLWSEVGAVADAATQARFSADGVLPITPALGAAILSAALAAGGDIAAVRVLPERLAAIELVNPTPLRREEPFMPGNSAKFAANLRLTAPLDAAIESAREAFTALEHYGLARVANLLRSLAGEMASRRLTPARLLKELGVAPDHARLANTLLSRLAELGWVEERDGLWRFPPAAHVEQRLAQQQEALAALEPERPWLTANRRLLDHCLDAYPEVLRGRLAGASVLFPDGDTTLVGVAYQGNPVSDRANALLGAAVVMEVETRLRAGAPLVRILEVGAGTGGSTLPLLKKLLPWRDRIRYRATDISPYLANSLRDHCRLEGWEIEAGPLDISREPEPAEQATQDVIVAANVVHATTDIALSLRRLKSRLMPGGRLLLNELTASRDLGTLVFGLTPQWWTAEDPATRLPGGPAVAPAVWLDLLTESGFVDPLLEGVEGDPARSSQSLVTGLADAWRPVVTAPVSPGQGRPVAARPQPQPARLPAVEPLVIGDEALEPMLAYLGAIFTAVLGIDPADLRPGDTFERYGVESLSALEIRNRIATDYPQVSSTLLFEHNTLRRLADHLLAQQPPRAMAESAPPAPVKLGPAPEPPGIPSAAQPSTAKPAELPLPGPAPDEPIAIIGFAGRFPGGDTPDAFWSLLAEGRSALGPVPAERWDQSLYLDNAPGGVPAPGRCRTRWGGFLDSIDRFDPLFFGIAPLEADTMDPQERLFIEACWNALEDAGVTPARLAEQARTGQATGSVGVFCGVMNTAYQWLAAEAWRAGEDQAASSHFWSIPNRVSYLFDFDGPSIAVDTACSSSLTALHLACESLRRGECGAALAGGVNVIAHPRQLVNLGQAGMIAAGAECRAFGAGADGFVDGEGVGVALLKPLSRALADGDRIDGLIIGSAINAGGKTGGYTVPNPRAQGAVIRAALARAGIGADGLCLVETHGTGTELGDPIEVAGLLGGLAAPLPPGSLPLGTLKANIGHLESAAGIASLIKVLLQLRHDTIVPARHAGTPNPLIRFGETPFRLPDQPEPWTQPADRPRRAAISGFGAGGANAHVIIEAGPDTSRRAVPASPEIIPLSARSPSLLAELAERMEVAIGRLAQHHAGGDTRTLLADIGRTLRLGRVEQAHRVWIEAHDLNELLAALRQLTRGEPLPARPSPVSPSDGDPRARPVSLPTSPFERQRYWLNIVPAPPGGVTGLATQAPGAAQSPSPMAAGHVTTAPGETRLLNMHWAHAPLPRLPDAPLDILLIGGAPALAEALSQLGHRVERLSASGEELEASRGRDTEQALVIVETRAGKDDAGPMIRAALEIARHAAQAAGPRRVLHVAPRRPEGDPLAASAAIAALLRSLTLETTGGSAGTLTLDKPGDASAAPAIAEELAALTLPERHQIHRRGATRLRLGIAPVPSAPHRAPLGFREGGSYLLVGGLGEVGRRLAGALINRYQARVTLLGRTPPDARTMELLMAIGAPGQINYRACDLADPSALTTSLADIRRDHGAIHGVLHLARHVDPAPLHALHPDSAARTLAPKVTGSLNLLKALADQPPDWIAFFSSLAAWAGQAGGADYAAACGFQDGLALAGDAVPLVSIAWPQWEHDHYLDAAKREQWTGLKLATLDVEAGLDALERALARGPGAYGALRGTADAIDAILGQLSDNESSPHGAPDWAGQLAELDEATLAAYRDYLREHRQTQEETAEHVPVMEAPPVAASAPDAVAATVLTVCSEYLKIPPERLAGASFAELGLDSIRALHLAERLQRQLQRPVEPVMLFEHPTVERLSLALALTREAA